MELTRDARLMFVGLLNFCDDAGIHPASTKTLKAEVFPADDIGASDVRKWIDECIRQGLLIEYQVEGKDYWQVTGWHHQKIDQPTYKHPTPDGRIPEGAARRRSEKQKPVGIQQTTNVRKMFAEQSPNISQSFDGCSPPEGKGKEGNEEAYASVPGKPVTENKPDYLADEIVRLYHEAMPDNPRVKILNKARRKTIMARWKEAASLDCEPFGYTSRENGLVAWRRFFEVCAESEFLTGRAPAQPGKPPFFADIDFLMSPAGFAKCLENKYHREVKA